MAREHPMWVWDWEVGHKEMAWGRVDSRGAPLPSPLSTAAKGSAFSTI